MRLAPRSILTCVTAMLFASCGGDSNEPEDPFPAAAGVYEVTGDFDGIPSSEASFEGTVELTQASRESGALQGSASLLVDLEGDIFNVADDVLANATVSPSGVISFTMAGGTATWTFSGTLSGNNISQGRHTLSDGSDNISGDWQGTRTSGANAQTALEAIDGKASLEVLWQRLSR